MATLSDIVTGALRKLGIVAEDEAASADAMSNGVTALNDMLHAWKLAGVDITHTTLTATDTFPLGDEYVEGTKYVLASRLSPDYQVPQSFDADDWFRKIQAAYATISTVTMPTALTRMPSRYWRDSRIR